mmetsp:Transcript_83950/g.164396  ORF Transcript_83950/g.164396 Transcript_83950/m.164396 type:complete len:525 (+) Transcript_83950:81-1655(+)
MYRVQFCRKHVIKFLAKSFSHQIVGPSRGSKLMAQGRGVLGSLGVSSDLKDATTYQPVHSFEKNNSERSVEVISAGWGHSVTIDSAGKFYVFGRPFDFQSLLRIDRIYRVAGWLSRMVASSSNSFFGDVVEYFPIPTLIDCDDKVIRASASAGLTAFLTKDGTVYCFGLNSFGQCGSIKRNKKYQLQPEAVDGLPPCKDVEVGLQHGLALTEDGQVFSWGKANKGQLGNISKLPMGSTRLPDDMNGLPAEVPLARFNGDPVKQISAGFAHSAALTVKGDVLVWGRGMSATFKEDVKNRSGLVKMCEDQLVPRLLELPGNRKAVSIASSNFHLVVLAEDGSLWAIGMGEEDKNANPHPLRVQTDFHFPPNAQHATTTTATTTATPVTPTAEVDETDGKHYVVLPVSHNSVDGTPDSAILRGHHRVTVLTSEAPVDVEQAKQLLEAQVQVSDISVGGIIRGPTTVNRANFPCQGIYEVMVHEGEAYLIELLLPMDPPSAGKEPPRYKVRNFSSGWKHNLLVVDDLP